MDLRRARQSVYVLGRRMLRRNRMSLLVRLLQQAGWLRLVRRRRNVAQCMPRGRRRRRLMSVAADAEAGGRVGRGEG